MAEVEDNIANILNGSAGLVLSNGSSSRNLFVGPERAPNVSERIPTKAAFVLQTGGLEEQTFLADNVFTHKIQKHRVQIMVRGDAGKYEEGRTFARAIFNVVNNIIEANYGIFICRSLTTDPIYLGADDQGVHRWSINLHIEREV